MPPVVSGRDEPLAGSTTSRLKTGDSETIASVLPSAVRSKWKRL